VAVDDLSFHIEQGAVFGLLGPNGAGKTSTIRMMIGITAPDSGSSTFSAGFSTARPCTYWLSSRRARAVQKDESAGPTRFSGGASWPVRGFRREKSLSWCERLEISGWLEKKIEELSKGMQQKIQFAATLLHDPDFIIMDEPFGVWIPSTRLC